METIDDTTKGRVVKFKEDKVIIETDDGFQLSYLPQDLLKLEATSEIQVSNFQVAQAKSTKETPRKKIKTVKPKQRNAPKMEVDLHIHQLVPNCRNMSNFDILNLQLETAKRQLDFAIRKRIQKVVFIHGVGEGVLKEELKYLFKKYDNLKYYDGDYQKYGLGATEVYIYQNV